jgi:hypothetical protein
MASAALDELMKGKQGIPDPQTEIVPMVAREMGVRTAPSHREHLPTDDATSSDEEDDASKPAPQRAGSGSDTETSDEEDERTGADEEEEVRFEKYRPERSTHAKMNPAWRV